MKREEKNNITRQKIINASLEAFAKDDGYNVSVNDICKNAEVSKGIIYHYFKNKDELYLFCIKLTFEKLLEYLKENIILENDFKKDLQKYLDVRYTFFENNNIYKKIFFYAILIPPVHIQEKIEQLRFPLDEYSKNIFFKSLNDMKLKPGISEDDIWKYWQILQSGLNNYFNKEILKGKNFDFVVSNHESQISKILQMMLYGIIENGGEND